MGKPARLDLVQECIDELLRSQILGKFLDIPECALPIGGPEIPIIGILDPTEFDEPGKNLLKTKP